MLEMNCFAASAAARRWASCCAVTGMPIAGASELDDNPVKAMRLFGEDLVLFRDLSGRYGLLDRHCPHRRADLSYGFVEKEGIRCNYHGWMMDNKGGCVEQPFEDTFNPNSPLRKECTSPGLSGA